MLCASGGHSRQLFIETDQCCRHWVSRGRLQPTETSGGAGPVASREASPARVHLRLGERAWASASRLAEFRCSSRGGQITPRRVRKIDDAQVGGLGGSPASHGVPLRAGEACRGPVCAACGGRRCLPSGGSSLHDRGTRLCPRRVRGAVQGAAQRAPSDPVRPQAGPSTSRVPTEDPLLP